MSVVNRMLQDIDRRLGSAKVEGWRPDPAIRVATPRVRAPGVRAFSVLLPVLAAVALFVAWDAWRRPTQEAIAEPPKPAIVAVAATVRAAPPAMQPVHEEAPPAALKPARSMISPTDASPAEPSRRSATATSAPPVDIPTPRAAESFKMTVTLSPGRLTRAAAAPAPVRPEKIEVPVRHVASEEMVAVARGLWSEGSRSGALASLRDALAIAEASRDTAAAKPLVRELARLEVADNRPQAALDLLMRFDGALDEDAEILALRGNAQQRLGFHNDATLSYLAALRLRPGEARWMLGAAISLAADGKRDEAQRWVDRAQGHGAISPEVAAYLRQLGLAAR